MKHFTLLLLLVISLLHLSSCQSEKKRVVIGISQCSQDEWRSKMNMEMSHEAALHQGVELVFKTSIDNSEQQIKDIEYFINSKVDLLIVSPNTAAPITPILEKAYDMGIPVVLVDRKIWSNKYTAFIGADNFQIGKDVGNYVVDLLKGKGSVLEIRGLDGSTPTLERHQGFYSVISKYKDITYQSPATGSWSQDTSYIKADAILRSNIKVDVVFAHNDRMAVGAYNAAKNLGREKDIAFVGIDALSGKDGGIEQVLKDRLLATFIYPTGGDKIIRLALNILEGKGYSRNTFLNTSVVDKTNVRVIKLQSDEILEQRQQIEFFNNKIGFFVSQYNTQRYILFSSLFIVTLLVGFFIVLYLAYRSKNRLYVELENKNRAINEQKITLEEQRDNLLSLSEQLDEATHAKLNFFTNISHEFRTPLTLISGPLSSLFADSKINVEQKRLIALAQKNVEILLKLVDQIIDFRKYELGKLQLRVQLKNLKDQFVGWNDSFSEIAKKKQINFGFEVLSDCDFLLPYDVEKMESIYFNLLSNALKFTPEKGVISVTLRQDFIEDSSYAIITVANSGKQLSEANIQHLFDRFYQVDPSMAGSGIGLALVKAFVELHGGTISVITTPDGMIKFSFTVPFKPVDKVVEINEVDEKPLRQMFQWESSAQMEVSSFGDAPNKERDMVLIVDDNADIRAYMRSILDGRFEVIEAKDGVDGFNKAVKYVPNIIVSDVMMPKMDGVELCRQLKQELSTSHIPIILLTACSLDEERIHGFENGANEYISKPFNSSVLEVRIRNLIENNRRLKELFSENLFFSSNADSINDLDKTFIEKLQSKIEDKYSDSALNVEDLGREMGLSRAQLYRKVKAMTNYSPNELLKIFRLKKAHNLLATSELNINEIAYEVGFTAPSYFTKCYKEYYEQSPTDYQKQINDKG